MDRNKKENSNLQTGYGIRFGQPVLAEAILNPRVAVLEPPEDDVVYKWR
jgi:hypothetical protein